MNWLNRPFIHLILIAILGILSYSNTFNVPFQWDEQELIENNPIVKNLSYFLEPSKAKGFEFYNALKSRYIGYLTFALNYKLHGFDVTGYHVFNITIHILNALLVYFLVVLTFRTPYLSNPPSSPFNKGGKEGDLEKGGYIALFSALLFVSHPIQTEAVTYIFQRLASLCAFFYLLSIVFYIKWRLQVTLSLTLPHQGGGKWWGRLHYFRRLSPSPNPLPRGEGVRGRVMPLLLYLASLLSAILAMKTKENAFTLPIVITLYEFFFFKGSLGKRVLYLIPLLLTMLIIPLTLIGIDKPVGEIIGDITTIVGGYEDTAKKTYLLTQFRVIVTYIRLLFLPINQNIDYDYPVFNSFLNPQVFLSFLFLLSIFLSAIYLLLRSKSNSILRLTAFGIFWFFITLSVESSIIPIPMVINEYRVYLPSAGMFIAIVASAFLFIKGLKSKKTQTVILAFLILILLVLSSATYARNAVWKSKISLWEDVVRKSPYKAIGHNNLGFAYVAKGLYDKAIEQFLITLQLTPNNADIWDNKGTTLSTLGRYEEALKDFEKAVKLKPDFAEAWNNRGTALGELGRYDEALKDFEKAIELKPDFAEAHYNLGIVYIDKGELDKARKELETALQINPDYYQARQILNSIK